MTRYIRIGILNGLLLVLTGFHFLCAQVATETFSTAGTYTFTVPLGVTSITVQAWGGGGGARGDGTSSRGGGGGGAFAAKTITVSAGQTYTIVVGTGGVATGNPGQSGQNSVFGSNLVVANGGTGGTNSGGAGGTVANSTGTTLYAGGAGGDRGSTILLGDGGGGGGGSALSTGNGGNGSDGSGASGGNGGTGAGNGGNGGNNNQSGNAGVAPGGGGGARGSGGSTSGKGASGRVVVTYSSTVLDLAITKIASTSSTTVGQAVTFTVSVTNNGPASATNTVVNDLLPSGYTFIRATLSPSTSTYASDTGIWTIGSLASGASVSMVLVGIVNTAGTYNNTANVTANQPDSNTANNSATTVVTVCKAGSSSPLFN